MKIGIIGLGRMGEAIVYRALQGGHSVVAFDIDPHAVHVIEKLGAQGVTDLKILAHQTEIILLMVPAGHAVDDIINTIQELKGPGTIIIDGGNSKFTDSVRRAETLKNKGIFFIDCGISGGIRGRETGFSLMIGGDRNVYDQLVPLFTSLAASEGFGYVGKSGSGHYVKMVHNAIEYALMQSYAEGFQLLKEGNFENFDLAHIASLWQHGSVIRSWLLELIYEIFLQDQDFKNISGYAAESGMGRWAVQEAQTHKVPTQLVEDALEIRLWSEKTGGNYATKIVSLLRNKFGGHPIKYKAQ